MVLIENNKFGILKARRSEEERMREDKELKVKSRTSLKN
jgi:hypothetical protein